MGTVVQMFGDPPPEEPEAAVPEWFDVLRDSEEYAEFLSWVAAIETNLSDDAAFRAHQEIRRLVSSWPDG